MGQIQLQTGDGKASIDLLGVGHHVNALRVQLVIHKASTFSESASLASEAKGLAVSINQATSRFFFFTIALSGLKEKHTLSSYTETENNEIQGTKTTIIQMDDTRSILFVCCFGFFFFFAGCLTYIPTVHSNTEVKICRTTI